MPLDISEKHPKRVQEYRDAVAESLNRLTSLADTSLYRLAQQGPGTLYKKTVATPFLRRGWRNPFTGYGWSWDQISTAFLGIDISRY